MEESIAKIYLSLESEWGEASSEVLANNVEKYLTMKYPECHTRSVMYEKLSDITESSSHAVYAWLNKSRGNVKIPLVKLCMIAETLHMDVRQFFMED